MILKWMNSEHSVLNVDYGNGTSKIVEPTSPEWSEYSQRDDIAPYVPLPAPTPEEIHAQELAAAQANRQAAFQREADPLFFKWQAGEGTEEAWQAKRAEIRERYPYPE